LSEAGFSAARADEGSITSDYSFSRQFVQTLFSASVIAATAIAAAECVNLSSPRISDAKVHPLPFSSDFVVSWPLSRPADADAQVPASPEAEVVELFDELRARLLRYLLVLGLSAHDGEEIIQESFLLLFQHLQRGKSRQNLRAWVFRVARNLALKQRAANQLRLRKIVEFNETLPERVDRSPNPEEQLRSRQRQTRLWAVMRALPEQDQSCLCLRAEGLRYREIARVLGRSLASVATSLARSLARLSRADGG
jgi:RNA polymerase sigma-70 factor (ECF subfamily)